jgi:uncharacterized membrane protein
MSLALFFRSFLLLVAVALPGTGLAQELHQDYQEIASAEVLEVVSETERDIVGTDATVSVQVVSIELTSGKRDGEVIEIENEVVTLHVGDKIFVNLIETIGGDEYITYFDYERRPVLIIILATFVGLLLFFTRWQGVRALLSLGVSIAAIFLLLVPALLAGYPPVITIIGIAGLVLFVVLFGTHGINARSGIAFVGTLSSVIVTGLFTIVSMKHLYFTGFSADASVYLNFATDGELDLAALLLGSIIIGILGVLDDVSITQASVVQELRGANGTLGFYELYNRAIKVGRDHIGSLVNTLALAYVGVALPLILLYSKTQSDWWLSINQEVIAVELVRIVIGSMGLILAVPITTAVAAWYFSTRSVEASDAVSAHGHHHHHH